MKKISKWILLVLGVIVWILIVLYVGLLPVQAERIDPSVDPPSEDQEIITVTGCGISTAVNFLDLDEFGIKVIDDGSCYWLHCDSVNGCEVSSEAEGNWDEWDGDLPPTSEDPQIEGGCTDPEATNFMDQQWFPQYIVVENGSCEYPEPEISIPQSFPLEWY